MEVSALRQTGLPGLPGSVALLRLQSDERLITLVRRGHHGAFEALVARYQARLLSFCRHMLGSKEDAEDVLQEVFAAAFNAILADEREINVRPWLYRIARNRSLNHLRRSHPVGVDSMDVYYAENGQSTAEKILGRESFRQLITDVQKLPETQRTALLLREIDALSYEQIAETMQTTVPSVKSLLVRARISLAEAAEARKLNCEEVRIELGEVAEGLVKISPPVRRHVRECERCRGFRKHLKENNHALAAIFPVGPLLLAKKLILAKLGSTASAGHVAAGGGATAGAAAGATAAGSSAVGGLASIGAGAIATKAAIVTAAAAIVTAGAVAADHGASTAVHRHHHTASALSASATPAYRDSTPVVIRSQPQPVTAVSPHRAQIATTGRPAHRNTKKNKPSKPTNTATTTPSKATTESATSTIPTVTVKPVAVKPTVTEVTSETTALPTDTQTTASTPPPSTTATSSEPPPASTTPSEPSTPSTPTSSSGEPPATEVPAPPAEQDSASVPPSENSPPPPNPEESGGTPAPQTTSGGYSKLNE